MSQFNAPSLLGFETQLGLCYQRGWRLFSLSHEYSGHWRLVLMDSWDRWEPGEGASLGEALAQAAELMGQLGEPPPPWSPAELEAQLRAETTPDELGL